MSYLVMARRWRPQTFKEVVGQEHVTRTLQRAITRGRVAHAYIFAGPRGVGKTTTARLLAMAVNTETKQNKDGLPDIDPENPLCLDIASGSAMDVIEIDGASNNKVEDVRQLRESIKYAPASLKTKVYIIDEVHMLSQAAFNALLKTLEEPPDHAMFIFATTEIHKVPATVLSRCQRFDFKRIHVREIKQHLERIVREDKLDVSDDALVLMAEKAEGALRDALSVLDQLVAYQGDEPITGEVVRQALGLIGAEIYFRTTDIAATGDVAGALNVTREIAEGGHDPREYLHGLQRHTLRLLFLRAGGNAEELDVSEQDRVRYTEAAKQLEDEDLLRIGEWASESEDLLREALDPQVRLELLLVRIARMDRAVELGELLERMGVPEGAFHQPAKRRESVAPAPVKEPEAKPVTSIPPEPEPAPMAEEITPEQNDSEGESPDNSKPDNKDDGEDDDGDDGPPPPDEPDKPTGGGEVLDSNNSGEESDEENSGSTETEDDDSGQLSLVDVQTAWLELCDRVNLERRTLGAHLEQGAPTAIENGAMEITFDPQHRFESRQVLDHRDLITKALRLQFGVSKRIIVKTGTVPESARPPMRKTFSEERRDQFEQLMNDNPAWGELVRRFDLKHNDSED